MGFHPQLDGFELDSADARNDHRRGAGNGTIHLAVFLHQGPPAEGVDYSTPYPVVTVELDEQPGLRFTGTPVPAFRLIKSSTS
ncbi:MAG: hypothetical protein F2681_08705 [Actinobacteria bacterium]|uniref:Unannotated protein n=1 Tax=freshwater metagenome TaxID=449393 RepID=A0A6J6A8M5_9ZZZZ|nr:hypothetical protein [Actinomycetota bacterium]MSW78037.1 hypothetical protein [Actinomycetota bacterium]MSX53965.1 hypothetical protein [Actinomycetota bacterium]MSX91812.1 hypothetical protein [Actinomycetota bacterium]MSZ83207.1 hypothetical protein [Actinomycetota bacterium]